MKFNNHVLLDGEYNFCDSTVNFKIVPSFIRVWLYNFITKNKHKWFGKVASCLLPTADLNSRFIKPENIKR